MTLEAVAGVSLPGVTDFTRIWRRLRVSGHLRQPSSLEM